MASQPRIKPTLVFAIRMEKMSKSNGSGEGSLKVYDYVHNQPPIKGITGQQDHGAQSIILSGGYKDDEDHGEWFLYTGRYVFKTAAAYTSIILIHCFLIYLNYSAICFTLSIKCIQLNLILCSSEIYWFAWRNAVGAET